MSLTIERMRALVRRELGGLDENDLDDDAVDELLNMSLWALEDSFPFKTKETVNTSLTLAEDDSDYDLSGIARLDAITSVSIRDSDGVSHKLARMTRDWYDANYSSENTGLPVRYFREGNTLYVYPIPDDEADGLTIRMALRQSVASMVDGATSSGLPRNWDEIVVAGAAWRGHKANGDYNMAQQAANFQLGLIRAAVPTEAKEERDSRYARVNVIHEFPEDELEGYEG